MKREGILKTLKKRNKDTWCSAAGIMKQQGFKCDAKACETKLKNLKRAYTTCIDHNNKTGNNPKKCAYFDELHDIFHSYDNVTPLAVFSNRKGLQKKDDADGSTATSEDTDATEEDKDENYETQPKRKKRATATRESGELVTLFKDFVTNKEKNEEKKLEKLKEMHDEKMNFLGQFLKVLEKSCDKK